jgi:predicted AlkP superfamily pyrophosphatase or phosphodiesterase
MQRLAPRSAPRALSSVLVAAALLAGTLLAQVPTPPAPQVNPQQPGNPTNPFEKKKPKKPAPTGGNTAEEAAKGPGPPKLSRRVLVISLDGAGSDELHQLYRDGVLSEDGFDRFFKEGEVAEALAPVDPTLTATNHVSLVTGYPPAKTGIVGNRFLLPAAPWPTTVSGFAAPIATDTLWEAARRQKKKVAILTWPGADAGFRASGASGAMGASGGATGASGASGASAKEKGEGGDPRRRADWGLVYVTAPEYPPQVVSLARADWKPAELPGDSPKIASYSPLLAARVELSGGVGEQSVDLIAVDRTDDGKVNYDGLVVLPRPRLAGVKPTAPFGAGQWSTTSFYPHAERVLSWVKLLAIEPDLAQVRVYLGGGYRTVAYGSEFARALAENGLAWPGPPDDRLLAGDARLPAGTDLDTWSEQAERFAHFFFDTMQLASERRDWELLLTYVPVLDEAGHRLTLVDPRQAGFSPERRDGYAAARRALWELVDRELRRLIATLDLSRTTVVVVSDHGMTPVFTALDANARLRDHGALKMAAGGALDKEGSWAVAVGDGGMAHVYLSPPASAARLADLEQLFSSWKVGGEAPLERVMTRQQAAEIGLDNPASGDLILFAREGYAFSDALPPAATDSLPPRVNGTHGYLATHSDMRAVYMALGAGVKAGQGGIVQATDLAARISGWLGIKKPEASPPRR